jgi:hypothetical protein
MKIAKQPNLQQLARLRKFSHPVLLFSAFLLTGLNACQKEDIFDQIKHPPPVSKQKWLSPNLVLAWNLQIQKTYTLPLNTGLPPVIYSRLFAMYHTAMHDALNAVSPRYATYAYDKRDEDANPSSALSQAVYEVLKAVGPKDALFVPYDSLLKATLDTIPESEAKTKGISLGKEVAKAILAKRAADSSYLAIVGFKPAPVEGTKPGEFRFFAPLNTNALSGWSKQQTWVIPNANLYRPGPPDPVNSDAYATDFNETKDLGRLHSPVRTGEQTTIGIFWAENTSRGWNSIAREIISKQSEKKNDAWDIARLLAVFHITIADAYISVFDAKNFYYYWRPISAIRLADQDGNAKTERDSTWVPELGTPGIPEYPSAHAWTGAAAAQVLIRFLKTPTVSFSTTSGYSPGVTRSFSKITDAVRENGLSRIYIGYHFRKAVMEGEGAGYKIGDYVYDHALPLR